MREEPREDTRFTVCSVLHFLHAEVRIECLTPRVKTAGNYGAVFLI